GDHPLGQRQLAEREQRQGLLPVLEGVVVRLAHVLQRDVPVRIQQVAHHARGVLVQLLRSLAHVELAHAQDVDDQHRVVGHHRPEPFEASFTRMPMRGRTPMRLEMTAIKSSSEYFSTTMITLRPSFEAMSAVSMYSSSL